MTKFQIAIFAYGLFLLALGIEAYTVKHEIKSLLGGGSIGLLEIMLAVYTYKNPRVGFIGAAVLGLLTALMFVGQAVTGRFTFYPGVVVIAVSGIFVYYLMSGHFAARRAKRAEAHHEH